MKRIPNKIHSILIILVIIGTVFVNLNAIVSIIPKVTIEKEISDNETSLTDRNEIDYTTISEISNFITLQANLHNIEILATVYSSGLLIETDKSLIVIGHGHIDTYGQYFIADYSASRIVKFAENKEYIALLSCYSDKIMLNNNRQLTYLGKIDLQSAMNDLAELIYWISSSNHVFTKNIILNYFDPGGTGGGSFDPNSAPSKFMNGLKFAQSDTIYWNLNYESACISLTNYMLGYTGRLVKFTFTTTFYEEKSPDVWELKYHSATYDGWSFIEGDMNTYIKINNIVIDGVYKNDLISITVDDLMVAVSQDGKTGFLDTMGILAGIFAGIAGIFLTGYFSIKIAVAVTATAAPTLAGLTTLAAMLAIFFGFLTLYTIIVAAILNLVWI